MRNLWGQIVGWLIAAENTIITVWTILGGIANIADQQIRNLMRTGIRILIFELCLLVAGFIFNFQGAIVLAAIIAAIVWLIGFKIIGLGVDATAAMAAGVPLIGARLSTLTQPLFCEVRKLLPPFITIAMAFSFIAVVIAIRGVGYYGFNEIMIFTSLALFASIFASYIGKTTKLPGWLMFGFVMYLFIGSYLLPVQVQGTMDWLEGLTIRRANAMAQDGMNNQLAILPAYCPLYNCSFGKFQVARSTSNIPTTAKIVGRKNDPDSKEGMLEVILPVCEGVYVGGQSYFVPTRLAKPLQKAMETPSHQIQKQEKIVHFKPGKPTNTDLVAQLGDTIWYIEPTAPFMVPGKEKWHEIATTTEHESTGVGTVVIYGNMAEGYVQIKIVPKNT